MVGAVTRMGGFRGVIEAPDISSKRWTPRVVNPRGGDLETKEVRNFIPGVLRSSAAAPLAKGFLDAIRSPEIVESGRQMIPPTKEGVDLFDVFDQVGYGINHIKEALGKGATSLKSQISSALTQEKEVDGQIYRVSLGAEAARNLPVQLRDYTATGILATAGTYAAVVAGAAAAPVAIPAALSVAGLATAATLGSKAVVEGVKYLSSRTETRRLANFLDSIKRVKIDQPDLTEHSKALPPDFGVCYFDIKGSTALFEKHGMDFVTSISSRFMQMLQNAAIETGLPADYLVSVHGGDGFTAFCNKAMLNSVKADFAKFHKELESMGITGRLRFATQAELGGDLKINMIEMPSGRLQPLIHGDLDAVFKKTDHFQLGKALGHFGKGKSNQLVGDLPREIVFKDGTEVLGLILSSTDKKQGTQRISRVVSSIINEIYGDSTERNLTMKEALLKNSDMTKQEADRLIDNSDLERLNTFVLASTPDQTKRLRSALNSLPEDERVIFGLSVGDKIHKSESVRSSKEQHFNFVGSNNLLAASVEFKKMLKSELQKMQSALSPISASHLQAT
ncbi:MAG: hypothetical protein SFT81_05170 [Candidatus Caenarcaniphilales bacterium]|nr:hypothetical protein [Candidatus Caenarcaniphilales bacterium]